MRLFLIVNKKEIIEALQQEVKKNLELAIQAAQNTYADATHEDSKAENKYDTRGLEASYLAGAQAKRVSDLRDTLSLISNLKVKNFNAKMPIALEALVSLSKEDKILWMLLLSKGGGQNIKYNNCIIQVATPESPIGRELISKYVGDVFKINNIEYEILSVL